jgi:site-specific recombinase XerD
MSTWLDNRGAVIDRYVRSLIVRTDNTRRLYRIELDAFRRFIINHGDWDELTEGAVTAWVQARARQIPLSLVIDRAGNVNRFLDTLVREGYLASNPFRAIRNRYGIRRLAPLVRALASTDPAQTLETLRPLPRWGSSLGPLMREHLVLMRAMGYRYVSQEVRFAAFDRFLQTRPELTEQPLRTMVQAWSQSPPTIAHAWSCAEFGADLSRAMRRMDPTVTLLPRDRRQHRQIRQRYRQPYIYSPAEVSRILEIARTWPAPRWPLLPLTMYTMLVLAYCAGLRLGEILRLNVGDVLLAESAIEIRNTKFFKSRRLPLAESVFSALGDYLDARSRAGGPADPASPLFWHDRGEGRYSMTRAEKILVAVLRRSGLKTGRGCTGPRIHDMRHAFVVNRMLTWYREGIDAGPRLQYLVTYLGHKSLHSTLTYLTVTQELLQHASERYRTAGAKVLHAEGGAS